MKRLLAVIVGICVVGSVLAQSSFTIVRPADGSKVREKIRVLIPKNSIEGGSYVGVFLNGKFVEAVVPPVEGNYRVYTLDTKGRGIPDGEMKLELVKYEGGDAPRIVDRSSVSVTVGNQMNIPIPAGGVHLRYGFYPDQQMIYSINSVVTISALGSGANEIGGRPAQFPTNEMHERALYVVDNTYGNGDALLRVQNLPDKGKDYAILALAGEPEPRQVFDYQMQPTYMRVTKTGRPVFGSVPQYFGFSSGGAAEGGSFVYGSWPLPVLPEKAVAPGSRWEALYQLPATLESGNLAELSKVTEGFPARGEFVDAEWELGHPCAKIHNSIAAGTRTFEGQKLQAAGSAFNDDKVALDETVYFALDTHKIVKIIRSITIDRKMTQQTQSGGGGGAPGAPGGPPGMPGRPGKGGQMPPPGGGSGGFQTGGVPMNQRGKGPAGGGAPGIPGGGQGPGRPGQMGGGGGGGATRTIYIRTKFESIFTLEQ
jgi:hypothetical protein